LQILASGLVAGTLIALIGYSYHLTWTCNRTINFAQGPMMMVGGLVAYEAARWVGAYELVVVLAAFVGAGCGLLIERLAVAPVKDRLSHAWVLSTFGVAIILQSVVASVVGVDPLSVNSLFAAQIVHIQNARITSQELLTVVVSVAMIGSIAATLRFTRLGKAFRAVAHNPVAASLVGIRPSRMGMLAYAASAGITAAVGALDAPTHGVQYNTGVELGFEAFFGAMLGGLDSAVGVIAGGLVLGILAAEVNSINPLVERVVVLGLILVVLAIRPYGVRGRGISRAA
jgi:branched-chain amino acid transport system permease protein